jgi:hypothetical protein
MEAPIIIGFKRLQSIIALNMRVDLADIYADSDMENRIFPLVSRRAQIATQDAGNDGVGTAREVMHDRIAARKCVFEERAFMQGATNIEEPRHAATFCKRYHDL